MGASALYVLSALLAPGPINTDVTTENPFGIAGADSTFQVLRFLGGRLLLVGLGLATLSYVLRFRASEGDERWAESLPRLRRPSRGRGEAPGPARSGARRVG